MTDPVYILSNYNPPAVIGYFMSVEGAMAAAAPAYRGDLDWYWPQDGHWFANTPGAAGETVGYTRCAIDRVDTKP